MALAARSPAGRSRSAMSITARSASRRSSNEPSAGCIALRAPKMIALARGNGRKREDTVGLWVMIAGLVVFLGAHTFTTRRDARARAIAATGEGTYKILYSLVSALGLALIVWGFARYRATGWIDVWYPPVAM